MRAGDTAFVTRAPSAFHASLTKATSIPATGATVVFDKVDYDLASEYSASTGTFTAQNAGVYLATCATYFTPNGTPAVFELGIAKGGNTLIPNIAQSSTANGDAGSILVQGTGVVQLAKGDALTCTVGQLSGASMPLDVNSTYRNSFSVTRIY